MALCRDSDKTTCQTNYLENGYTNGAPNHLMKYSWFHGRLSTREAEGRLNLCSINNSYLFYESNSHKGTLSLITKHCDELHHFLIPHKPGGFEIEGTFKSFFTIPDLVSHYQDKTNWVCERGICLGSPCLKRFDLHSGNEFKWSGGQFEGAYNVGAPLQLMQYDWFHGTITREEAEERLKPWGIGYFLVRQSEAYSHQGLLSLSANVQGRFRPIAVTHMLIQSFSHGYNFWGTTTSKYFQSIPELITYYQEIGSPLCDGINDKINYSILFRLERPCPKTKHESDRLKRESNKSDQELSMGNQSDYEYLDEYRDVPEVLSNCDWFHGKLTRRLAELKLRKFGATYSFLIYENRYASESHRGMLVLAIKNQDIFYHYVILRSDDDYTIAIGHLFPSVSELISYHQEYHIYIQSKSVCVYLGSQCCQC